MDGWDLGRSQYTKETSKEVYTLDEILQLTAVYEMRREGLNEVYEYETVDEIVVYARLGCDTKMEPLGPEVDLEDETNVSRDKLENLLQEGKEKLDNKRISKKAISEVKALIDQAEGILASDDSSQEQIDNIYNKLRFQIVKYTTEDFTGIANIVISGFDNAGKKIEGSGFNSNTGLIYFDNGREVKTTEHLNKIENIDISENNEFTFKILYRGGEKLNRIIHNGKRVKFEDNFGYETKKITISLDEGLNEILVDYRPEKEAFNTKVSTDEAQELIEQDKYLKIFDVRTQGEFNESHIENAINSDFYKTEEFSSYLDKLEKDETYLVYCRTQTRSQEAANIMVSKGFKYIYWMNGGMTDWLKENKPYTIMSELPKALDLELIPLTSSDNEIKLSISVKNLLGDSMVKASVNLDIFKDGEKLETKIVKMSNKEFQEFSYQIDAKSKYEIKAIANLETYEPGFMNLRWDKNMAKLESFEDAKAAKRFEHLKAESREAEVIEKVYGRQLGKYKVLDFSKNGTMISEIQAMKAGKPSIVVFGYPGCGGCVYMMREMSQFKNMNQDLLDNFNFLEVITSVDEKNPDEVIKFTKERLKELKIENIKDHVYFDGLDGIWARRLGLTTTPNVVLLDGYGRIVNIGPRLKPMELRDLLKVTFNIDLGDNIPEAVDETSK